MYERCQKINFIGRKFITHYGIGGIIKDVVGPFEDGTYSIVYKDERVGKCFINYLHYRDGVFYKEGKPLKIMEQAEDYQLTLFI